MISDSNTSGRTNFQRIEIAEGSGEQYPENEPVWSDYYLNMLSFQEIIVRLTFCATSGGAKQHTWYLTKNGFLCLV